MVQLSINYGPAIHQLWSSYPSTMVQLSINSESSYPSTMVQLSISSESSYPSTMVQLSINYGPAIHQLRVQLSINYFPAIHQLWSSYPSTMVQLSINCGPAIHQLWSSYPSTTLQLSIIHQLRVQLSTKQLCGQLGPRVHEYVLRIIIWCCAQHLAVPTTYALLSCRLTV